MPRHHWLEHNEWAAIYRCCLRSIGIDTDSLSLEEKPEWGQLIYDEATSTYCDANVEHAIQLFTAKARALKAELELKKYKEEHG